MKMEKQSGSRDMHYANTIMGAVLAGGQSRRMGRDKALLISNGQTLLSRQVELLQRCLKPGAKVLVSGDYDGFECAPDLTPGMGPLGGIEAVLERTQNGQFCIFIPVDMPRLERAILAKLWDQAGAAPAVRFRGSELPLLVKTTPQAKSTLRDLLNRNNPQERSVGRFFDTLRGKEIDPPTPEVLLNANTPEQWREISQ